jgi:hypothetical protein
MMATDQGEFDDRSQEGRGSTPKPDPTVLTTEALLREIGALRTLIDQRIAATELLFDTKIMLGREGGMSLRELLEEKLASVRTQFELVERQRQEQKSDSAQAIVTAMAASDKAIGEQADAVEMMMKKSSATLQEKFISVDTQFELIERQRVEQKMDTKAAVDAALAAAKEAVKEQTTASDRSITKSETATSEQLKQMNVTFTTAIQGIATPISDIKDRVTALEAVRLGRNENRTETLDYRGESRANMAIAISVGMGLLTMLTMIIINAMHISGQH